MKRCIVWLLIMSCMLSCMTLSGCEAINNLLSENEKIESEPAYELFYISNGDGTCYVIEICTRADVTDLYTVEIPEFSPKGDRVVAVTLHQTLIPVPDRNLPYMLSVEAFEKICATAQKNGMLEFDYQKMCAYYQKLSLEGLTDSEREALLEIYPILEKMDVYVFEPTASDLEKARIAGYLSAYCEFYEKDVIECHAETEFYVYRNYTAFMDKLILPASVQTVNLPTSTFSEIIYKGTREQWSAGSYQFDISMTIPVTCSDGELTWKSDENYWLDGEGGRVSVLYFSGDPSQNTEIVIPDGIDRIDLDPSDGSYETNSFMLESEYDRLMLSLIAKGYGKDSEEYLKVEEFSYHYKVGNCDLVFIARGYGELNSVFSTILDFGEDDFEQATKRAVEATRLTYGWSCRGRYGNVNLSDCVTSMSIPSSVFEININWSVYSFSRLKDVYYADTMERWERVFGYADFPSGVTIHCTDGDIVQ